MPVSSVAASHSARADGQNFLAGRNPLMVSLMHRQSLTKAARHGATMLQNIGR